MARIYLSSTFSDLKDVREEVSDNLRKAGHTIIEMEDYVASDERPADKCKNDVADCDLYVGLFAWRYGYIPKGEKISITEMEYRHALLNEKPALIFIMDENAPWPKSKMDNDSTRINALRNEFTENKLCSFFTSTADLCPNVINAVNKAANPSPKKIVTQFLRSQWLGIQFYQEGSMCPLTKYKDEITKVTMTQAPFEIKIPQVLKDDTVMLAASWNESFFDKAQPGFLLEDVPFFRGGTGMADTSFGDGFLGIYTDDEAHHHLDWGGRLYPGDNNTGLVMYNGTRTLDWSNGRSAVEAALPKNKNIYMIIHLPRLCSDGKLDQYNFEKFVLAF